MSYRIKSKPHPHPHRTAVDLTTPAALYVDKGCLAHFAFPCWYQEVHKPIPAHHHNKHAHDYIGWPSPTHVDHVCQLWSPDKHSCSIGQRHECSPHCRHYIDLAGLRPIHLTEEGYNEIELWVDGVKCVEGVNFAWIDNKDDWVVRVQAYFDSDSDVPEVHWIAAYAIAPANSHPDAVYQEARRDLVFKAKLIELPVMATNEE